MTIKYFRGCAMNEAVDIQIAIDNGNLNARRQTTFWTDNYEQAAMYARRHSNGAVVEVEMDEQPRGIQNYFSVGAGDSAMTTIRQWELPTAYFNEHFSCYVEETTIHSV